MSPVENSSEPYSIIRLPHELIIGFNYVEKETKKQEDSGQKSCCKKEACKETRKNSFGSEVCKIDGRATTGDKQ